MTQAMAYKQAEVSTSDRVRIIGLLYDGAINFIKMAEKKIQDNDVAGKGLFIVKATAIVTELSNSLDAEQGGEIAANLHRLYDFVVDRLITGNMNSDIKSLHEAINILEILRSGWKELEAASAKSTTTNPSERLEVRI
ncbi:MAG: flagellar export chaperone FliS [Dissulfurispiraceae bacterium]|jgi:flagellar protein FliS|nr:flagellar export chaperone FliS [Dissulfurispiraceae bacterium]